MHTGQVPSLACYAVHCSECRPSRLQVQPGKVPHLMQTQLEKTRTRSPQGV